MTNMPDFEVQQAHKYFSAKCFNKAWDFIDRISGLSDEEQMEMLHTAIASLWHWSQREDVKPENLSVGYWQVSRAYCLINQPQNAHQCGQISLRYAKNAPPFFQGYAYEALARAEMIAGKSTSMKDYLAKANKILEQIDNEEEKNLLAQDLETIV